MKKTREKFLKKMGQKKFDKEFGKEKKNKVIHILVDEKLYKHINTLAKKENSSISEVVRYFIFFHTFPFLLEKYMDKKKDFTLELNKDLISMEFLKYETELNRVLVGCDEVDKIKQKSLILLENMKQLKMKFIEKYGNLKEDLQGNLFEK